MNHYLNVLQNYATFSGRARRSEYWAFFLFQMFFIIALGVMGMVINFPFLGIIYAFATFLPGVAVAVRRMHDVGKSGWYALIPLYSLILTFTEGDKGDNAYGPDPKAIPLIDNNF